MKKLRSIFLALCGALLSPIAANADLITINYTADNAVFRGGICANLDCTPLGSDADYATIFADGTEPNASDWRNADSVSLDLSPGTYDIAFIADNFGVGGSGNPAGFLAEILWDGQSNYTSSAWDVTIDGINWVSATEWAQNGTGIWGSNLIGEISTSANWIWTDVNFNSDTISRVGFRTSINVVPEPGTLALLGAGLIGIGFARRRKKL